MLTGMYWHSEMGRVEGFGGRVFQPENSVQRTQILNTVIAIAEQVGATLGGSLLPGLGHAEQIVWLDGVSSLLPSAPARTPTPRATDDLTRIVP